MDNKSMIIIGIITLIVVLAFLAVQLYKKKNIQKMFEQIAMTSKQVPKSKRNSFILLMFVETMSAPISKTQEHMGKLNNPKYIETQMLKMSKLLKDSSSVTDKRTKHALKLFNDYLAWEEAKANEKAA